jgi:hypothetical protein
MNTSTNLRKGLSNPFSSLRKLTTEKQRKKPLVLPCKISLYGIVRTKGASGEKHLVKKLVNELISANKKVFICLENFIESNDYYVKHYLDTPVNQLISINELMGVEGGVINLNWRNDEMIENLFSIIDDSYDIAVVFACGTSSAGPMFDRVKQLSRFCEKIYVSVNGEVDNSTEPAQRLAKY